jgi:hypothetical protein
MTIKQDNRKKMLEIFCSTLNQKKLKKIEKKFENIVKSFSKSCFLFLRNFRRSLTQL